MIFLIDLIFLLFISLLFVYYTSISSSGKFGNVPLKLKVIFYTFVDTIQLLLSILFIYQCVLIVSSYDNRGSIIWGCYVWDSSIFTNQSFNLDWEFTSTLITDLLIYPDWLFSETNLLIDFFNLIILLVGFVFLFFMKIYFARLNSTYYFPLELPFFLVVIVVALRFLLHVQDIFLLLIVIEIISFSSIILIAGQHSRYGDLSTWTIEAALKYFLMGGLSLILFALSGILLTYLTGSSALINIFILDLFYDYLLFGYAEVFYVVYSLFFIAFFIKVGVAPFQYWVADVYDGSDFLVTVLLMILISPIFLIKLIFLTKLLIVDFIIIIQFLQIFFMLCGILSIIFGTLGAFTQKRLKRFLAFGSIVHSGFVLLYLSTHLILGFGGAFFYVLAYWFMIILFFSLLFFFKFIYPFQYFTFLNDLKIIVQGGLLFISILCVVLLSFAGIPPFLGFFSKYFLFLILLIEKQYFLVFLLIPMFLINAYLYIRLISLTLFELRELETESNEFYVTKYGHSYNVIETYNDIDFFVIPDVLSSFFNFILILFFNIIFIVFYLDWILELLFFIYLNFLLFL